jgi:hypothetical protein
MFTLAEQLYEGCQTENINGKIPHLNKGGCGIFAEHFYKALKQFGLFPKLAVITYADRVPSLKLSIATNENYGLMFVRHIVVIIDKKMYDSKGVYKTLKATNYIDPKLVRNLPLELLEQWNKDRKMWNKRFDHRQIKTVENIIKESYNKLEKDLQVLY